MHEALGSIPRNRKRKHRNESSHILSVILNKFAIFSTSGAGKWDIHMQKKLGLTLYTRLN
jgi:hypothetical protein